MRTLSGLLTRALGIGLSIIFASGCSQQSRVEKHVARAQAYVADNEYIRAEIEFSNALRLDASNLSATEGLGLIFLEQGRIGRAIVLLLRARERDPGNIKVRAAVARLYLGSGKYVDARREARFVLDQTPEHAEAPIILAEASATAGDIREARSYMEGLLERHETAALQVGLGQLAMRQAELAAAERAFQRALELDPNSSAANLGLGNLHKARQAFESAETYMRRASELANPRSPQQLAFARFKLERGEYEAARKVLEELTTRWPDFIPAWSMLAELAAAQNRYEDCRELIAKILAQEPTHPGMLLLSGRMNLAMGDKNKALEVFEYLTRMYASSAWTHYQLAVAALAAGQRTKATAELDKVIELDPEAVDAIVLLANLHIGGGQYEPAIASLQKLVGERPHLVEARLLLANAYRLSGRPPEAIRIYQQLQDDYPTNPQPSWFIGLVHLQQSDLRAAHEAFARVLTIAPDHLAALEQLVNIDLDEKRITEAAERVAAFQEAYPEVAEINSVLAKVHIARRDTAAAESALRELLRVRPDSRSALVMLARLYLGAGQGAKAVEPLEWIIGKNPDDVEILMMLASARIAAGDEDAARAAYERVITLDAAAIPALNNLAYLYAKNGDLERAYETAQKARNLAPYDPHVADTLGWVLFQRGDLPWSHSLLRESSAKLPNEAEVMFHWGMVQYAMGAEAEARTALQVALDTSEAFDGRAEAVRRMSILDFDPRNADDKVRGSLEAALREDPKDAVALMRLAESRTLAGAENEAVTLLQRALDIYPGNMRALTELERLHLQSPTGVREVYDRARKAVELAPYDPDVAYIAGRTAFLAGEYHAAARYLREAAQRREDDPGLWFDLARAIYSIGRVDEAAAAMERVTSMEAPDALQESAAEFLSMIAVARSRIANAATEARIATALAQNPADVPTLVAAAELKLARSDTDGAIRHFEEVLGQYPDFAPAQKALARLYASDPNMVARAGELARKARETMPGDPELTGILGIIAYHERNYGQATQLLQESTAAGGSGANLEFFLGMAFWAEGNHKAGRRHLEQAIELGLPPEQAAEARRMLTQLTD